jgi:hypothetical protein
MRFRYNKRCFDQKRFTTGKWITKFDHFLRSRFSLSSWRAEQDAHVVREACRGYVSTQQSASTRARARFRTKVARLETGKFAPGQDATLRPRPAVKRPERRWWR